MVRPNVAEADFFRDEAKQSTARSVKHVEQQTSAEVVVAVRRRSGDYRVAAYHCGFLVGGLVIAYLLIAPQVFSIGDIALDGLLGFGLGFALALNVAPLLRLWAREAKLAKNVADAARVAFFDLGISRTSGRNGLLVYASLFERRCVLLTDIGLEPVRQTAGFRASERTLSEAVKHRDLSAFQRAIADLGALLAEAHPRSAEDVNELPDEVQ